MAYAETAGSALGRITALIVICPPTEGHPYRLGQLGLYSTLNLLSSSTFARETQIASFGSRPVGVTVARPVMYASLPGGKSFPRTVTRLLQGP